MGRLRGRASSADARALRRRGACALLALAALACGVTEPLTTSDVVGRYVLASVGGAALPVASGGDTGSSGPPFWYASEYVFRGDGTYTSVDVTGPRGVARDTGRDTNTRRLASRAGADTVWVTFGHTTQSRFEFPYAVLQGGRALRADKTYIGTPLPAREYERR